MNAYTSCKGTLRFFQKTKIKAEKKIYILYVRTFFKYNHLTLLFHPQGYEKKSNKKRFDKGLAPVRASFGGQLTLLTQLI